MEIKKTAWNFMGDSKLFFYMNVSNLYLLVEINMHSMVTLPSIHLAGMV